MSKKNPSGSKEYKGDEGVAELRARVGLPLLQKGTRTCLRCDSPFKSEDVKRFRICNRCKGQDSFREAPPRGDLYPNLGSGFSGKDERPRPGGKQAHIDRLKERDFVRSLRAKKSRKMLRKVAQALEIASTQEEPRRLSLPDHSLDDDYGTEVEVALPLVGSLD